MLSYLIHSPSLHLSPPPWEDPAHCGGAYITLADHCDSITTGAALHHHTHHQAVVRRSSGGESGGDVEHRRRCGAAHQRLSQRRDTRTRSNKTGRSRTEHRDGSTDYFWIRNTQTEHQTLHPCRTFGIYPQLFQTF